MLDNTQFWKHWTKVLAVAGCIVCVCGSVYAQYGTVAYTCLDTNVLYSQSIAVGTVGAVQGEPNSLRSAATIHVSRWLKGHGALHDITTTITGFTADELRKIGADGDQVVVFVELKVERPKDGWEAEGHGWSEIVYNLNLIDLAKPAPPLVRQDMSRIATTAQVVPLIEKIAKNHPGVFGPQAFQMGFPTEGGTVTAVPIDRDLERWAQKNAQSTDYWTRSEVAYALAYFKSEGNIQILRSLLNDPATASQQNSEAVIFFVKQAAYNSLRNLGIAVDPPVLEVPTVPR